MEDSWSFEKEFGFNPPRPIGDRVCIMMHIRKHSDIIEIDYDTQQKYKFESIVGRIVKLGSACFKGDKFKEWDQNDFYKVGDFVTFRVNPGVWFKYGPRSMERPEPSLIHGAPPPEGKERPTLAIIFDDAINGFVDDPDYVERE